MDAARELAQLAQRLAGAGAGVGEQLARASGSSCELLLGHAQAHAERHQPRLGAVVEVALDPPQLGLLDVDRAGPGVLERRIRWRISARRAAEQQRREMGADASSATSSGQTGQK